MQMLNKYKAKRRFITSQPRLLISSFLYLCLYMKKFLEKAFSLSLIFGAIAVVLCLFVTVTPYFIIAALSAGFFGFVLGCLHIIAVQRYGVKQAPALLLLLSLLINSVPLIYMMTVVMRANHA
jgi:hypothetical protein